jgi:hypothetical protein
MTIFYFSRLFLCMRVGDLESITIEPNKNLINNFASHQTKRMEF